MPEEKHFRLRAGRACWAAWMFLALLTAGVERCSGADAVISKEYQVKAGFLYNFTKFLDWPANKFADGKAPIVIGVLGKNPFGTELESAVKGRKVNGREVVVRQFDTIEDARTAHLLFVSSDEKSPGNLQAALKGCGVLTVGESEAFAKQGGIIRFTLEGDKLRFEINMDAADEAGLRISAQLQKMAKVIRRKREAAKP